MQNNPAKAFGYGICAVLLWSTVASAFKLSLRHLSPIELLFYSSLTAIIILGGILVLSGKVTLLQSYGIRKNSRSILLGLLNPLLYYLILLKAYDLLPAQEAGPINYTWGITLALLSIPLLKQKIGAKDIVAVLIAYFGVVMISTHGNPLSLQFSDPRGVALALVSTVIWSFYWIYSTRDKRDSLVILFLNFVGSFPLLLLVFLIWGGLRTPPIEGLLGAVYVGLIEMALAYICWLSAMKRTDNTASISILIFFTPFLSLIFIHCFVGEQILPSTIIGLVFIVAGLGLQKIKSRNSQSD